MAVPLAAAAWAAIADSRKRKETRYPELHRSPRCQLVVAGMEVGGRWSEEAWNFLGTFKMN